MTKDYNDADEYIDILNTVKSVAKELNVNQSIMNKLEALPSNFNEVDQDTLNEFYLLVELIVESSLQDIDRSKEHLSKLSDLADKWSKMFGSLVRKKKTKPKGKSPNYFSYRFWTNSTK